jgi:hypothetical protein
MSDLTRTHVSKLGKRVMLRLGRRCTALATPHWQRCMIAWERALLEWLPDLAFVRSS